MDYVKLSAAFGHDDSHYRDRLFIPVLDQHTFPTLKDKIRDLGVSTSTLHQLIMEQLPLLNWEDYGHLFPALFVDFDQSKLYSTYQEVTNFEEYVPEGWDGIYTNFYYLIPVQKQY